MMDKAIRFEFGNYFVSFLVHQGRGDEDEKKISITVGEVSDEYAYSVDMSKEDFDEVINMARSFSRGK